MVQPTEAPEKELTKRTGLIHLAGPREGVALCGTRITGPASPDRAKCLVCLDFTRRDWSVR